MLHLDGQRFGRLLVVKRSKQRVYRACGWDCLCDCGTQVVKDTSALTSGKTQSCGCFRSEAARQKRFDLTQTNTKAEAFAARHQVKDSGCWEWTGRRDDDGYGILTWRGKNLRAHRLSIELATGQQVAIDKVVCHRCDNPPCVNPVHLFVGTVKDNANDAKSKMRHYVGTKNGRAKLTEEQVAFILKSPLNGQQLANQFGVTRATINAIRRGLSWVHLNQENTKHAR